MNITYETTKERAATIPMPNSMVDSLNPSETTLALALAAMGTPEVEVASRKAAA